MSIALLNRIKKLEEQVQQLMEAQKPKASNNKKEAPESGRSKSAS